MLYIYYNVILKRNLMNIFFINNKHMDIISLVLNGSPKLIN